MSLLEKITPSPRRVMTLFYLIDTSASMRGARIGTLNSAMEESIPLLKEVAIANDDAMIKVAIFYAIFTPVSTIAGNYLAENLGWNDILVTLLNMLCNFVLEYLYDKYIVFRGSIDTKKWKYKYYHLLIKW